MLNIFHGASRSNYTSLYIYKSFQNDGEYSVEGSKVL